MPGFAAPAPAALNQLGWLIDHLVDGNSQITHATAVSVDGLPLAASRAVDDEVRDQLCAIASGLTHLAAGLATFTQAGPVEALLINLAGGWALVQQYDNLVLLILTVSDADMGLVHHQLEQLAASVGPALNPGGVPHL